MKIHDHTGFRESVLEQVRQIVLNHISEKSAKVYLFGSWARAEEKRSSDIDIAIEFGSCEAAIQTVLMNVRNALEESTIPYRIDVVHLNTANETIVKKVREEGILWTGQRSE